MKNILAILAAVLSSVAMSAEAAVSLKSPSTNLSAAIEIDGQTIEIALSNKDSKVVDVKTLQLDMKEDYLRGHWVLLGEKRRSVDQTWQPVYGERARVKDCYNEVTLSLALSENQKNMTLHVLSLIHI